jgi:ATP-dependent Clp protease adapter protein ClpS
MVSKKHKGIVLMIYDDSYDSIEFIADVISYAMGYDETQATTCALIIKNKGKYAVKTFKISETQKARDTLQLFNEHDISAELVFL